MKWKKLKLQFYMLDYFLAGGSDLINKLYRWSLVDFTSFGWSQGSCFLLRSQESTSKVKHCVNTTEALRPFSPHQLGLLFGLSLSLSETAVLS